MEEIKYFFELHEYYQALHNTMKDMRPDRVTISTFGLYAGVTTYGDDVRKVYNQPNYTATFLDRLVNLGVETEIVVGVPEFHVCVEGCKHCVKKWNNSLKRYYYTVRKWPEINWVFVRWNHLKCVIFEKDGNYRVFCGGRNLSESTFSDVMLYLPNSDVNSLFRGIEKAKEKIVKLGDLRLKK